MRHQRSWIMLMRLASNCFPTMPTPSPWRCAPIAVLRGSRRLWLSRRKTEFKVDKWSLQSYSDCYARLEPIVFPFCSRCLHVVGSTLSCLP